MANTDTPLSKKQLITLALAGGVILILFAAGFLWLHSYVRVSGPGGGETVLALSPFWLFPYLVVSSAYAGFFAAKFAQGRSQPAGRWGIAGFALTLLLIIGFPAVLAPVFPNASPTIFAGPAISAFLAPVLAVVCIVLFLSMRKKTTV